MRIKADLLGIFFVHRVLEPSSWPMLYLKSKVSWIHSLFMKFFCGNLLGILCMWNQSICPSVYFSLFSWSCAWLFFVCECNVRHRYCITPWQLCSSDNYNQIKDMPDPEKLIFIKYIICLHHSYKVEWNNIFCRTGIDDCHPIWQWDTAWGNNDHQKDWHWPGARFENKYPATIGWPICIQSHSKTVSQSTARPPQPSHSRYLAICQFHNGVNNLCDLSRLSSISGITILIWFMWLLGLYISECGINKTNSCPKSDRWLHFQLICLCI